jgi:hypothetical protein
MILVDCGADDARILERIGVFLAALRQPFDEIADRAHRSRRIDLLLRLADAFAHPGEIEEFHRCSTSQTVVRFN